MKVHLQRSGATFEVQHIEIFTSALIPGITDNEFQQLSTHAKESCPISKALHAVPIALIATLHTA